jgi:hypothetical protein
VLITTFHRAAARVADDRRIVAGDEDGREGLIQSGGQCLLGAVSPSGLLKLRRVNCRSSPQLLAESSLLMMMRANGKHRWQ